MKKSRKLKLSTIIAAGANCVQVKLFRELFGESVMVTEELVASVAEKFGLNWVTKYLLSPVARKRFDADHSAACDWFYADITVAQKRHDTDTAPARKRFRADIAESQKQYDTDFSVAVKRYHADIAAIVAREYINNGEEK